MVKPGPPSLWAGTLRQPRPECHLSFASRQTVPLLPSHWSALSPVATRQSAICASSLHPVATRLSLFSPLSDCPSSPLSPIFPVVTRQSATYASPLRPSEEAFFCAYWTDIVNEAITFFRTNVFFRNFDIKSSVDKLLIYLTFDINVALKRLEGCRTLAEGTKTIINLGLEKVHVPGEPGFLCRASFLCLNLTRKQTTFPLTMKRVRLNSSKAVKRSSSMFGDSVGRGCGRGVTSNTMNNSSSSSQMEVDSVGVGESATPTPVPSMGGSQANVPENRYRVLVLCVSLFCVAMSLLTTGFV
ncbi:hypothetical protein ACLB2K_020940 [Fragaria x ananassa]